MCAWLLLAVCITVSSFCVYMWNGGSTFGKFRSSSTKGVSRGVSTLIQCLCIMLDTAQFQAVGARFCVQQLRRLLATLPRGSPSAPIFADAIPVTYEHLTSLLRNSALPALVALAGPVETTASAPCALATSVALPQPHSASPPELLPVRVTAGSDCAALAAAPYCLPVPARADTADSTSTAAIPPIAALPVLGLPTDLRAAPQRPSNVSPLEPTTLFSSQTRVSPPLPPTPSCIPQATPSEAPGSRAHTAPVSRLLLKARLQLSPPPRAPQMQPLPERRQPHAPVQRTLESIPLQQAVAASPSAQAKPLDPQLGNSKGDTGGGSVSLPVRLFLRAQAPPISVGLTNPPPAQPLAPAASLPPLGYCPPTISPSPQSPPTPPPSPQPLDFDLPPLSPDDETVSRLSGSGCGVHSGSERGDTVRVAGAGIVASLPPPLPPPPPQPPPPLLRHPMLPTRLSPSPRKPTHDEATTPPPLGAVAREVVEPAIKRPRVSTTAFRSASPPLPPPGSYRPTVPSLTVLSLGEKAVGAAEAAAAGSATVTECVAEERSQRSSSWSTGQDAEASLVPLAARQAHASPSKTQHPQKQNHPFQYKPQRGQSPPKTLRPPEHVRSEPCEAISVRAECVAALEAIAARLDEFRCTFSTSVQRPETPHTTTAGASLLQSAAGGNGTFAAEACQHTGEAAAGVTPRLTAVVALMERVCDGYAEVEVTWRGALRRYLLEVRGGEW